MALTREQQEIFLQTQSQENQSRGVAWAQRCLEGENQNETMSYEGGREAQDLLQKCGWKRVGGKWSINNKRYLFPETKYRIDYESVVLRSGDGRFEAKFTFSHRGHPGSCWCGFRTLK